MSLIYDVQIHGDQIFIEKTTHSMARVQNLRPAWLRVAGYLMGVTKERFDAEGPGWQPLSEDWRLKKAAKGWDTRILRQHGNLFQSVTTPRANNQILIITNESISFGSALEYAPTHQFGLLGIPKREFLRIEPQDDVAIGQILGDYISSPFTSATYQADRVGDIVAGKSKRRGWVSGTLTEFPAYGGGRSIRGPGGQFIAVYED